MAMAAQAAQILPHPSPSCNRVNYHFSSSSSSPSPSSCYCSSSPLQKLCTVPRILLKSQPVRSQYVISANFFSLYACLLSGKFTRIPLSFHEILPLSFLFLPQKICMFFFVQISSLRFIFNWQQWICSHRCSSKNTKSESNLKTTFFLKFSLFFTLFVNV